MNIAKAGKIFGILLQIGADISGVPYSSKITKLIEECLKSEVQLQQSITQADELQRAKVLGIIGTGQRAMEYFFSENLSEKARNKQLERAWGKFEDAYCMLNHLSLFAHYKPRVALSLAICHILLNHPDLAVEWAETALKDNKQYKTLTNDDILQAKEIASRIKRLPS
jgi:hypothetical protein